MPAVCVCICAVCLFRLLSSRELWIKSISFIDISMAEAERSGFPQRKEALKDKCYWTDARSGHLHWYNLYSKTFTYKNSQNLKLWCNVSSDRFLLYCVLYYSETDNQKKISGFNSSFVDWMEAEVNARFQLIVRKAWVYVDKTIWEIHHTSPERF